MAGVMPPHGDNTAVSLHGHPPHPAGAGGSARALVDALRARLKGAQADCIETHISWVLLAGDDAWKIKKPLKLDFLDFSTLERRHAACLEELRINRRTAPGLYLDVVPITGSVRAPRIGGNGPVLEWAVHMRRFPADAELTRIAAEGRLRASHIDALARRVATLHADAARATPARSHGQPEALVRAAQDNFQPLAALLAGTPLTVDADALARWSAAEGARLTPLMRARLAAGQVRECHGDLHLGNLLWLQGDAVLFDAIEFDPALRWIDVIADVAFLFMDLHAHGLAPLAWRFVNAWLDLSGDHAGVALLPWCAAYRALVRAKVAALRAAAPDDAPMQETARYLRLARGFMQPRERVLWLASGVSGSGKSSQSQPLVEQRGLVALHSDVERKRLFDLAPLQPSAGVPGGIYTADASARTYAALAERARAVLAAGQPVLVDATFLRRAHRAGFIALARELGVPCRILAFDAPEPVLRERVRHRAAAGGDASEATEPVLERQIAEREPFADDEQPLVTHVDTTQAVDWARLLPD